MRSRRAAMKLASTVALAARLALPTAGAPAQEASAVAATDSGVLVSDAPARQLFTSRDAALAGGFVVLTVAMFPLDRRIAHELRDSSAQANLFFRDASKGVEVLADPGGVIIGLSLYTVGRIAGWREVADLGLHGTEAIAVAGGATTLLKGLAGRARPYASRDTNPRDFRIGRGFRSNRYESFPSGHATVAFAAAAAVTSESQRWWPRGIWLVAPVMYGGATLVGLSRIYHDAHWASDVALGAALGTFGGIKVVRYSHQHPGNRIDRVLLPLRVSSTGGRASLWWSYSFGR